MDVMKLLSNDVWGFASNCFACDHRNDAGLRIPFHHDVETQRVVADFELDDRFSGAPCAPISAENSRFIRSAANTPTTPVETPGTG